MEVLLVDAGDGAYRRTVTAPTAPNPFAALEDLPTSPGEYRLYARIPSTDVEPPVQADPVAAAGTQSRVRVHVDVTTTEANGDAAPGLAYGAIGECQ